MKTVEKTWGRETWLENNELYCMKLIICEEEKWTSGGDFHHHPIKDETFVVLKGELLLDIEGKETVLKSWDKRRIRPGVNHRFRSIGVSCTFLEVSTPHSDEDVVRVPYEEVIKDLRVDRGKGLCSSCEIATGLEGGFAGMSGYGSVRQRYCPVRAIAIHFQDFTKCKFYKEDKDE